MEHISCCDIEFAVSVFFTYSVDMYLYSSRDGSGIGESIIIQPTPPPELPSAFKPPVQDMTPTTPRKRTVDELDIIEEEHPSKRSKTNGHQPNVNLASPSKQRRLDEDGLLLLDNPEEDMDEPELIMVDD